MARQTSRANLQGYHESQLERERLERERLIKDQMDQLERERLERERLRKDQMDQLDRERERLTEMEHASQARAEELTFTSDY